MGDLTTLRPHSITYQDILSHPHNPETWITPTNPYVIEFANNLEILDNGTILYKNKTLENNYISDEIQFAKPDFWQMPEYYLRNGMNGDCEDYAVTITSALTYKGIPAKVVVGFIGRATDAWTEYQIGNKTYITTTGSHGTYFWEKSRFEEYGLEPLYEIKNNSFIVYPY